MKHYTTKDLLERNVTLPSFVQDLPSAEGTLKTIQELSTKLKLNLDKIRILSELNVQVILGLTTPEEVLPALVEEGFPPNYARTISSELKEKIYQPLYAELKKERGSSLEIGTTRPGDAAVQRKQGVAQVRVAPINVPMPSYGAPPPQSPAYVPEAHRPQVVVAPLGPKVGARPAVTITPDMAPTPKTPPVTAPAPRAIVEQPKELPLGEGEPATHTPPAPVPTTPAPQPQATPMQAVAPKSEKEFKTPPVPVRSSTSSDPYREPIEP